MTKKNGRTPVINDNDLHQVAGYIAGPTRCRAGGDLMDEKTKLNERELPDDYPVFAGYLYVCDDVVVRSGGLGNIAGLKVSLRLQGSQAKVITSCDIAGRNITGEIV